MKLSTLTSVCPLLILLLNLQCQAVPLEKANERNRLVVLMLDGVRFDYFKRDETSLASYRKIKSHGVVADYVQPDFPSMSYPSWTTIVTGLYPDEHGITGNYIIDFETGKYFILQDPDTTNDQFWWRGHIPIWSTLQSQGINTTLHHWSRCNIPFEVDGKAILPKKYTPYDRNAYGDDPEVLAQALSEVVIDFKFNEFQAAFVYYPTIDSMGHKYGPNAEETIFEVRMVDDVINGFLNDLEANDLASTTNFVIVSDHGMSDNFNRTYNILTDFLSEENLDKIQTMVISSNAACHIKVKNPDDEAGINAIIEDLKQFEAADVYKKADIPDWLHFRDDPFIYDILLLSRNGWDVGGNDATYPDLYFPPMSDANETQEAQRQGGDHGFLDISEGYDSEGVFPDVRGIFMAIGPDFKSNYEQPWIKLVDEYQVFLRALQVEGEKHSGNWDRVKGMFKEGGDDGNGDSGSKSLEATTFSLTIATLVTLLANI